MERRVLIKIAVCVFLLSTTSTTFAENFSPIKLTDSELDRISAGYVELTITANAYAEGTDIVAIAYTNSDVRSNRNGRTVARGSAISTAIGEIIFTETGFQLDTDESIISLRAIQRIRNSKTGTTIIKTRIHRDGRVTVTTIKKPPRRHRGNRRGHHNNQIIETNTLRIRAVTRD